MFKMHDFETWLIQCIRHLKNSSKVQSNFVFSKAMPKGWARSKKGIQSFIALFYLIYLF